MHLTIAQKLKEGKQAGSPEEKERKLLLGLLFSTGELLEESCSDGVVPTQPLKTGDHQCLSTCIFS